MYADKITDSMASAIEETKRRRSIQQKYNEEHNIVPQTIKKDIRDILEISHETEEAEKALKSEKNLSVAEKLKLIKKLEKEMKKAAKLLEFEHAAHLRDMIAKLKEE